MEDRVRDALARGGVIDITTLGRKTGKPRRIEIWFHGLDGRLYLTGRPGRRSWYANLLAHPEFTFHLKRGVRADLPARASAIRAPAKRREVLTALLPRFRGSPDVEAWVKGSPLVEVTLL